MAVKAFTPTHVRGNPLIFAGCVVKTPKANPARSKSTKSIAAMPTLDSKEQKVELLIRDLWKNGTGSVHGMRVVSTYAKPHLSKTHENFLR